jgi:hypothetical protein
VNAQRYTNILNKRDTLPNLRIRLATFDRDARAIATIRNDGSGNAILSSASAKHFRANMRTARSFAVIFAAE